ncbi:DNA-directed RNA polymerase III subunit C31 [Saccharomyces cerevisiae]|uniref:DNA-directed RNA polymerase III subunit n=1 Tax=Saccharomyces cerevisiae (strain CEN.PK113-7D) TaxID=889517 RepID=N1NXD4_YEASC
MSSYRGGSRGGGSNYMSNLPFGLGYGDVGKNHITEFPSIPLPINGPITNKERSLAVKYINFGKTVKDGPFYTGSMSLIIDQQENSKSGKRKPNIILDEDDTNDGIERYSDKFLKKRKIGISIDDHPYNLNLFPNELYNVMGINKKKLLAISKFNNADDVFTGTGLQDENIGLSMLAKLKELAEDVDDASTGDGAAKGSKTGEGEDDDLADDDFEEDEDEEDDDDYNAEKYFNNGDDDDYGDEEDPNEEAAF